MTAECCPADEGISPFSSSAALARVRSVFACALAERGMWLHKKNGPANSRRNAATTRDGVRDTLTRRLTSERASERASGTVDSPSGVKLVLERARFKPVPLGAAQRLREHSLAMRTACSLSLASCRDRQSLAAHQPERSRRGYLDRHLANTYRDSPDDRLNDRFAVAN